MAEVVSNTLTERSSRYGDFTDNARIAEDLIKVFENTPNWYHLDNVKKQALRLMAMKFSRILSDGADADYRDNWLDLAGYAMIVHDRCPEPPADTYTMTVSQ